MALFSRKNLNTDKSITFYDKNHTNIDLTVSIFGEYTTYTVYYHYLDLSIEVEILTEDNFLIINLLKIDSGYHSINDYRGRKHDTSCFMNKPYKSNHITFWFKDEEESELKFELSIDDEAKLLDFLKRWKR